MLSLQGPTKSQRRGTKGGLVAGLQDVYLAILLQSFFFLSLSKTLFIPHSAMSNKDFALLSSLNNDHILFVLHEIHMKALDTSDCICGHLTISHCHQDAPPGEKAAVIGSNVLL